MNEKIGAISVSSTHLAAAPHPARSIITIDGIDGSGKSTFARGLAAALAEHGCTSVLVSIDDFRRPIDWAMRASGVPRS